MSKKREGDGNIGKNGRDIDGRVNIFLKRF